VTASSTYAEFKEKIASLEAAVGLTDAERAAVFDELIKSEPWNEVRVCGCVCVFVCLCVCVYFHPIRVVLCDSPTLSQPAHADGAGQRQRR
jgi:hypothetical protein